MIRLHGVEALQPVIAVLTYQRPDDLVGILDELVAHVADSSVEASILVVDNDEQPTAATTAARYRDLGVRYVHEPRPGIASARNRAFDESTDRRVLVFIDDDERPQPGWLSSLVETWEQFQPAAVVGPVISSFDGPVDPWIEAGGFFRRRRLPTGTPVEVAATNNLLLDLDVVRKHGLRFDDRFGISGGSDTVFTRQLDASGEVMLWCDEAIVTDVVPPVRLTRAWVLRRAERMGNSSSRAELATCNTTSRVTRARIRLTARAVARLAFGAARASYGRLLRSPEHHARGSRTLARGRGMLTGAWGSVVVEYGRAGEHRTGSP